MLNCWKETPVNLGTRTKFTISMILAIKGQNMLLNYYDSACRIMSWAECEINTKHHTFQLSPLDAWWMSDIHLVVNKFIHEWQKISFLFL